MRREEPSERRALKVTRRLSVWGNVTDRRAKYPYCKRTAVVHEPIATFALAGPCFRPPPRRAPDTVSVMRNPGTRIEMRYTYLIFTVVAQTQRGATAGGGREGRCTPTRSEARCYLRVALR